MAVTLAKIFRWRGFRLLVLVSLAMWYMLLSRSALASAPVPADQPLPLKTEPVEEPIGPAAPAPADSPLPSANQAVPSVLPTDDAAIKPRLELNVPSVHRLVSETLRSRTGFFLKEIAKNLLDIATDSSEGLDLDEALAIADQIKSWPDTAINAVTFAPNAEGRMRWAVRVDWPFADLHARVKNLIASDAANKMLQSISLRPAAGGGDEIKLANASLARLIPLGETASLIASHSDLVVPSDLFRGGDSGPEPPVLACRLNVAGTEKDSGATFLSSFNVITAVDYSGHVGAEGDWVESVQIHWPTISGMGAKMFFGKVKQTFFVPGEAFGAIVLNSTVLPGMMESMLGFGPQMMAEVGADAGVTETAPGPLANRMDGESCLALLPGTGFLPMPDVVVQTRLKRGEEFVRDLRHAVEVVNKTHREREEREPWHETIVRDRTVFWSEGSSRSRSIMPLVMHPVLFTTKELDGKGKDRDFLVIALTSTAAEPFVRRWVDLPRSGDRRYLPTSGKTDGQVWINWKLLYRRVHPYIDFVASAGSGEVLLPRATKAEEYLTDATVNVDMKYAGLAFTHNGSVPLGALVVPGLVAASFAEDESGNSDLARERLAGERLRVLYHHSKLFHKDLGRWPAELAELDGYVDFSGNPDLRELRLSPKKRMGEWFAAMFDWSEREKADETIEDEERNLAEDELYTIDWSRDRWSLGFKAGTFEHLEKLFVDQDGIIHRLEKTERKDGAAFGPPAPAPAEASTAGDRAEPNKE